MERMIRSKDGIKNVNLRRRTAIHEKCLDCSAWHPGDVAECTFKTCDLHPFRTGQEKQNPQERTRAIRKYCVACMNGQVGLVAKCPSSKCPLFPYRMRSLDRTISGDIRENRVRRTGLLKTTAEGLGNYM